LLLLRITEDGAPDRHRDVARIGKRWEEAEHVSAPKERTQHEDQPANDLENHHR
jgi:hypothetical protein